MKRVVFLDRDGVINEDLDFVHKKEDFRFIPRSIEGLKLLKNYGLIVVTNQSGIARGYYTEENMHSLHEHMIEELEKGGIFLLGIYYCPHHSEKGIGKYKIDCGCRKPKSGMLEQAAEEHNIDLGESWTIGDKLRDIKSSKNVGCKTILVRTGQESKEDVKNSKIKPDFIVDDLYEAAKLILREDGNN